MSDASVEFESESRLGRMKGVLSCAAVLLGIFNITALYSGNRPIVYLTKPTTMLVILAIAVAGRLSAPSRYANFILAGLAWSLVGDVFLMLPADHFALGLFSFLVAHLFYIAAFRSGMSGAGPLNLAIPFFAYGMVALWILLPGLGEMKAPVICYLLVILIMAWQSAVRWYKTRNPSSLLGLLGAVLFVASDTVIALNRFYKRFYLAEAMIMSAYFVAQWLIALSVSLQVETPGGTSTSK